MAKGKIEIILDDNGTSIGVNIEHARSSEMLDAYRSFTQAMAEVLYKNRLGNIPNVEAKVVNTIGMACTDGIDGWLKELEEDNESEDQQS